MSTYIVVQVVSNCLSIPAKNDFIDWANAAIDNQSLERELTIRIVDEEEGKSLNKDWRQKEYATNILSFPMGDTVNEEMNILGDIVICAPVVLREAQEQNKPVQAHWAHLVIHGVLHLQGYNHQNDDEASEMETKEITLLGNFGYANPYETNNVV